jgi:L-ascorbate metabolism protein UlaG (beta-lactamase superfamily)
MKRLNITYVSHACIKLEGEFGSLLTDPWILNEPIYTFTTWKFPAAIIPPDQIAKDLDYIYISHPHEDHLHIPSIDKFPRHIEILLPEYSDYPCLRSQTVERTFRELGFYNVRKIKPWETILLGNNTPFTIIPACKTKYWDWENSGFVLEHHDCKVLNMNDCPSDEELYAEVNRRFGEIDLGFIQYTGVSMFPGCYRMPMSEMLDHAKKRKFGWGQQRNMIEHLQVKRLAPFAGDFAWLDDRMFHCNTTNRSTPNLFENFVKENYPQRNIDVIVMYPSDEWSLNDGLIRNHPEIDWDNYVDEIKKIKDKLQYKVDAINEWIDSSSLEDLEFRSKTFTQHINQWVTRDYIDFTARIRVVIEGDKSNFSFVMKATPADKFRIDWDDIGEVDQSLFIRQELWASVLEGKVLLTNTQWAAENFQHNEFRIEIARFWFWFENYIDLNNRNTQALIDRALHPDITERIRPNHGMFANENEWSLFCDEREDRQSVAVQN